MSDDNQMGSHPLDYLKSRVEVANLKWWQDPITKEPIERNTGELLMLAVTELAEALEGDRKNLQDDKLPEYKMFDVEVVDCIIRLLDIAAHRIPKLGEIFEAKMAFNAIRKDHTHEARLAEGGKKY
jgi:hypothetical protein